jgi:hypothetical protein
VNVVTEKATTLYMAWSSLSYTRKKGKKPSSVKPRIQDPPICKVKGCKVKGREKSYNRQNSTAVPMLREISWAVNFASGDVTSAANGSTEIPSTVPVPKA